MKDMKKGQRMANNYFEELSKINCSDKVEKKNGLTYLSWAYAWGELKKKFPLSYYTIYKNNLGWNYFTDGNTCWVETGVTVVLDDGTKIEHIENLPIMDYRNKSIPQEAVTSFDVNKSIQRSLTKAVARHGLGLYIYAGEDLPNEKDGTAEEKVLDASARKEVSKTQESNKVELASKSEKEGLIALCNEKNINVNEVLEAVGWKKGEKLTKAMYGIAMQELMGLK